MDIDIDDCTLPSLVLPKEERLDFEEDVEKKFDPPRPRGRTKSLTKKPADKADIKAKLERSRQSARECRARKKLRYQYLEEIISETEKAIFSLRKEMDMLKVWAKELDEGRLPESFILYRNSVHDKKGADPFQLQQQCNLFELQQQQLLQQQQQQQQNSSPGSSLGAGSLSPIASGLSVSPGGGQMSPLMAMAMANHQNTMLSHQSVSPS